ncbi:MAG: MmgE/PrpD family protein [Deltaproteobacteria bacterium]|nr:MmgE/PrpD family protein [Deltaproteobacteria bacterium]
MKVSNTLAQYVVETAYNDLPAHVVETTKKSFLDALGVTLAASGLVDACKAFVELARESEGKKESTIVGFQSKVPAPMAAFANGSMAHALDFEDTHDRALVHSNAVPIPAAMAVAESIGNIHGKDFITALAIGSDIVCRLGLSFTESPFEYGWYIPPILGAFGAAAAVGKLLQLTADQIVDAFSLTLCQATCSAELRDSPHSDIRAVRDAFAAQAGVVSAMLAKKGIKGFDFPFEGKAGFYNLYARGHFEALMLTKGLGKTFESGNISFKPWPACRGTHAYIEAALTIMKEHVVAIQDITEIKIIISFVNKMLCEPMEIKQHPKTAIDAKFSLPFVVATALCHNDVNLSHFTVKSLKDKDVLQLARKMTYEVDSKLGLQEATQGFLEIRTQDEQVYAKRVEYAYGHPSNPISQEALATKFLDCAKNAEEKIPEEHLKKTIERIFSLEEVNDIVEVLECF